ncbi:cytospin-B-like [Rana temporaria]|uniref:cytospin-B-like n=1 Tax=Rana temporaria TaxID=8407 RepID=UPI001AADCB34|nr:cytospin-B-like [Rana temporaria]
MGGNSVKNAPDTDASAAPTSPSLYKPHQSPPQSPSQELFYTPVASPERRPIDTGPTPEELKVSSNEQKYLEGWGVPFHQAMEQIQQSSRSLDEMHSQFRSLLASGNGSDGPRIAASAIGWEARLTEVRKELKSGLRELGNLKSQYEALSAGKILTVGAGRSDSKDAQEELTEHRKPSQEDNKEKERLRDRVKQLERENITLTQRIIELQGEVQELNLLQSDLRTAVAVAERFREEAQEKLERSEKENKRLRMKGSDSVDWTETSPVNGTVQGYRSLPRGVILSSLRSNDAIVKSSSLMSVPPRGSSSTDSDAASARKERRGSLETLLNQSKATENLTEDSGSFLRRYGGSKRGVFLRWAQDRTCGYKHVVITNFSSSWVDGMALCALLHSYLPQAIPYNQLRPLEKRKNLQLAFQAAESVGITPLLTVDHMLQMQGPDWQKVLLYVESIYQKFEA